LKTFGGPIRVLNVVFKFAEQLDLGYFTHAFKFKKSQNYELKKKGYG